MQEVYFTGTNFKGIKIYGSQGGEINLSGIDFSRANLEDAILSHVNLNDAKFSEANLKNVRINGKIDRTDFSLADLSNANMGASRLNGTKFKGANLTNVEFGANDSGMRSKATSKAGSDFSNANCKNAKLTCNLSEADFQNADLKQAIFLLPNLYWYRANLSRANLSDLDLSGQNFSTLDLNDSYLLGANLEQAKLQNAILCNANLTDAKLEGADVTDADLSGANLAGTKLFGTNLSPVNNAFGSISIFSNSSDCPDLELLNRFRAAYKGLSYGSEADYPYEVFLWETDKLGEFTLEGLLVAVGHLRELSGESFLADNLDNLEWLQPLANSPNALRSEQEIIQSFRTLMARLKAYLSNLQVLKLAVPVRDFYLVLGNTPSSDWLGVSIKASSYLEQQHYSSQIFRLKDLAVAKPENRELIATLEDAIAGARFSSEYLEGFVWEIAERRSTLIHNLLDTVRITTTNEFEGGFGSDRTNSLLQENLTDLRLYRLSAGEIEMYLVGRTEKGNWIVIKTKAVET